MSSGRLACGPRPNDRFTAAWPAKPLPHPGARWVMRSGSAHNCRERPQELIGFMREKGTARTISMAVRR